MEVDASVLMGATLTNGCRTVGAWQDVAMSEAVVQISKPHAGITQITLNRPDKLNAMTSDLVQGLHSALDAVAIDPECRVVILTGSGRGFCAGLDLGGYGQAPHTEHLGPTPAGFAVQKHIANLIPHLRSLPPRRLLAGR